MCRVQKSNQHIPSLSKSNQFGIQYPTEFWVWTAVFPLIQFQTSHQLVLSLESDHHTAQLDARGGMLHTRLIYTIPPLNIQTFSNMLSCRATTRCHVLDWKEGIQLPCQHREILSLHAVVLNLASKHWWKTRLFECFAFIRFSDATEQEYLTMTFTALQALLCQCLPYY